MDIDDLLKNAREHAKQQRFDVANRIYREALDHESMPARLEAARYFASRALASGARSEAVRFCRMALEIDATASQGWLNLGVACRAAGDDAEALRAFAEAIRLDDNNYTAALCVGELLEATDRDGAAMAYFRAILQAQTRGKWRNRETTPASLSATLRMRWISSMLLASGYFRGYWSPWLIASAPAKWRAFVNAWRST